MTVYEKYAIEQEEEFLIGSLANINESIKSKDKYLFLENVSNFFQKNIREYNDKNLQKIQEIKRRQTKFKENFNEKNYSITEQKPTSNDYSIKFTRSFSFESMQSIDVNFNDLGKKNDILSINSKCSTLSSNYFTRSPVELFINDPILSQNILQAQETLKVFVIGDEKVGKSLFVNKILNKQINNFEFYEHTDSLSINKNLIYLVNKAVKLEIYDTNKVILESQMFKSK
jgi:GTPase SAR1 family protein